MSTFAEQVKHIGASNYSRWPSVNGDNFPKDFLGGNDPENIKTKADILKFLKNSLPSGHRYR